MTRQAYQFFKDNAGGIVGESALGAARLARAEEALATAVNAGVARVLWEWDDNIDDSWMAERERKQPHEWTRCAIVRDVTYTRLGAGILNGTTYQHTECLASLHGIVDADRNYMRVIEAELALEANL